MALATPLLLLLLLLNVLLLVSAQGKQLTNRNAQKKWPVRIVGGQPVPLKCEHVSVQKEMIDKEGYTDDCPMTCARSPTVVALVSAWTSDSSEGEDFGENGNLDGELSWPEMTPENQGGNFSDGFLCPENHFGCYTDVTNVTCMHADKLCDGTPDCFEFNFWSDEEFCGENNGEVPDEIAYNDTVYDSDNTSYDNDTSVGDMYDSIDDNTYNATYVNDMYNDTYFNDARRSSSTKQKLRHFQAARADAINQKKGRMYEQWCGGEHIALPGEEDGSTFILTAAHCITDVVRM